MELVPLKWLMLEISFLFLRLESYSCQVRPLVVPWVIDVCAWVLSPFRSVQFSHSVVSDSLRPHGLQHTRPPCPLPTSRVYSNSCPLSQWCHPTISSCVVPFSFHVQSSPASGSFPMSQFSASDGQSIGASASASVFPMNIQDSYTYICHIRYKQTLYMKGCSLLVINEMQLKPQ